MLIAVAGLVFVGVAVGSFAALDLVFSEDRRVSRRLKGLTEYERQQASSAEPVLAPFSDRVISPIGAALGRIARELWPAQYRDAIADRIDRAGHPHGMDVTRLFFAKVFGAVGIVLLVLVMAFIAGSASARTVVLAIVLGAALFMAPDLWLAMKVSSRQHRIVRELPDMLDLLTISVEAGLGFDAALAKLVRANRGPLAEEFSRALQEIQAGASRREALRHMAERVDVAELSAFNASIVQADIFGISVAQVLRTQSSEMRLRRKQRAEEQAQKAPVKMVFPLTLCILPATLIVVAAPAAIAIMQTFSGR